MRVIVFVFLFTMRWQPLAAQAKVDSLRSHYIQEYPDRFFVWPVIKQRQLSFEVVDKEEDQGEVQFIPNNEFTMGLGFYVLELGFEVTFGIPLNEKNKEIYGESKARDWQLNILGKKWGADVYYQKYTGYYINDSRTSIPSGQPFPQRPDISTTNFGVSGVYIFNHRRFSLRSSYTYAERELKSKGSFLLYGTLNSFTLSADSAILTEPVQAELGTGSDFKSLRYTTLSFAPGYSYNLIWRKLFLNGSLTVGPAHHWVRYEEQNGNVRDDISINSTASLRFAVGYNSDRVFGGIGISGQTRIVTFEDIKFSNSSVLFKAVIGYRFREFGFLKKRVWDFVPFL